MNFETVVQNNAIKMLSMGELIQSTTCTVINAYKDNSITSYTTGLAINMKIKDKDHLFHVHLDLSKRFCEKKLYWANLTPRQTIGYQYFAWLQKMAGKDFINEYLDNLYDTLDIQCSQTSIIN